MFAPLTLLFGPVLAYNVAERPDAGARRPGRRSCSAGGSRGSSWASLAGGYLFGFSTYVLSAELTHIFSAAVFLAARSPRF